MKNILGGLLAASVLFITTALPGFAGQLNINIGTNPNDGTGDPLRAAFGKINTNFTDLYNQATNIETGTNFTAVPPGSNSVPLVVRQTLNQNTNLATFQDASSNVLSGVSAIGNFRSPAGTPGVVAFGQHLNSSNGMYFPNGSNTVGISVAGTNALFITNNGSGSLVGLGKTNPATALDVNGTVNATSFSGPIAASNLTSVVSPANGGLGFADTNYVPPAAAYDNGSSDLAVNGNGDAVYGVTLITNVVYVVSFGANEDSGLVEFYCSSTNTYGYLDTIGTNLYGTLQLNSGQNFTNSGLVGNRFYLDGKTASSVVTAGVYQKTNTFSGSYLGDFQGSGTLALGTGSSIPQSVVQAAGAFISGTRLNAVANGGLEHYLISTNTANGSTVSIFRAGSSGYADINFFTYTSTNVAPPQSPKQWFAIGVGASGATFPYQQPYIESYLSQYPFYFVGAGAIFGGLYCTPSSAYGDFVWFRDGTTNTPIFQINRASGNVTNYGQLICNSNLTAKVGIIVGTIKQSSGTGSPNGAVTGSVGDEFFRTDGGAGTSLYVKESGTATTSGWVGK